MEVLQGRIDRTDAALEDAYGAEDEDKAKPCTSAVRRWWLKALQSALVGHAPEVRAMAGAILTVDREGRAMVHRGLREAEAKGAAYAGEAAPRGAGGCQRTIAGGDDAAPAGTASPTGWRSERAPHCRAADRTGSASLRWHWPRWFMAWFGRCCKAHCTGGACRWACAWKCRTGWPLAPDVPQSPAP